MERHETLLKEANAEPLKVCTKSLKVATHVVFGGGGTYPLIEPERACRLGILAQQDNFLMEGKELTSLFTLHPSLNHKYAFTLAEVLITLGVIGVVAAMTMPVIVANVKEKSLESALKKAQSSLINGYKQLMARESVFKVSNLPIMSCAQNASCFSPWHKSTFKVVDDSTSGFTGSALPEEYAIENETEASPFRWSDVPYLFRTADGMSYGVEIDDSYETFSVYADTNGKKSPNTVCKDMLKFRISGGGNISNVCGELAETNGCSIDNLSACNGQQCEALLAQGEIVNTSSLGLWNKQGHFVSFWCDANGVSSSYDWCANGYSADSYCR